MRKIFFGGASLCCEVLGERRLKGGGGLEGGGWLLGGGWLKSRCLVGGRGCVD